MTQPAIGTQVGNFKILERLGQGGMGMVFKALDVNLNRLVALKFISPELLGDEEAVKRFEREARLASQLLHTNIATIFELDRDNERHYIAMEFVSGETVRQRMAGRPLNAEDLASLARGAASGLSEAHLKGILHRDINSGNVVFAENGSVKILDFGLATIQPVTPDADVPPEDRLTQEVSPAAAIQGTLPYMAPEALRGEDYLPCSDVYSLGVLLYEGAAGQRPFSGPNPVSLVDAILHRDPKAPSKLNPELDPVWDAVILKCLEKDPRRRFSDAGEFLAQLDKIGGGAVREQPSPRTRRPWLHVFGILSVLISVLVVVSMWLPSRTVAPIVPTDGAPPKLVVLPFEHSGLESSASFLVSGLHEEVTGKLSQVEGLRVVSYLSASAYSGGAVSPQQLRIDLGVDQVLYGHVRQEATTISIRVALTECATGIQHWSRQFSVPLSLIHLNRVKEDMARQVLEALKIPITQPESEDLETSLTQNVAAYDNFRRGKRLLSMYSEAETREAIRAFEEALRHDPRFAQAHAAIAEAYFSMAAFGWLAPEVAYREAETQSKEALKLNQRVSEAHQMLANVYSMVYGDLDRAETHYRRAIALEPSNVTARSWLAIEYAYQGQFAKAEEEIQQAVALDPFSPLVTIYYGGIKYLSGDLLFAEVLADKAVETLQPKLALAYLLSGTIRFRLGRVQEAGQILEEGLRNESGPTWALAQARMEGLLAACDLREGRLREYRERMEHMVDRYTQDHMYAYPLAVAYALEGEKELAIDWLERAFEKRAFGWQEIRFDPFLADLREETTFQSLLAALPIRPSIPPVKD